MGFNFSKKVFPICVKVGNSKCHQCDGLCGSWFHKDCVKITTVKYNNFASNAIKKWLCGQDDYKKPENTILEIFSSKLDILLVRFSFLATVISVILSRTR